MKAANYILIVLFFALTALSCSSGLTSEAAQKKIQEELPAEFEATVTGIRKEESSYIAKTELTENKKIKTNVHFKFNRYDTGWKIDEVQDKNGQWKSLSAFQKELQDLIELRKELQKKQKLNQEFEEMLEKAQKKKEEKKAERQSEKEQK